MRINRGTSQNLPSRSKNVNFLPNQAYFCSFPSYLVRGPGLPAAFFRGIRNVFGGYPQLVWMPAAYFEGVPPAYFQRFSQRVSGLSSTKFCGPLGRSMSGFQMCQGPVFGVACCSFPSSGCFGSFGRDLVSRGWWQGSGVGGRRRGDFCCGSRISPEKEMCAKRKDRWFSESSGKSYLVTGFLSSSSVGTIWKP